MSVAVAHRKGGQGGDSRGGRAGAGSEAVPGKGGQGRGLAPSHTRER